MNGAPESDDRPRPEDAERGAHPPLASYRVEWLAPQHEAAFTDLFERSGSTCFCRYWHFTGDKNAWLERGAFSPEISRREQRDEIAEGNPRAAGLVALASDGSLIGWMKLAPRETLPKLRRLPTYRALDLGPDEGVFAIGCFLVDPAWRKRGVARRLVEASIDLAKRAGARSLEAYPRSGLHAEEAWTGPEEIFAGFEHVAGERPYPVLRISLLDDR